MILKRPKSDIFFMQQALKEAQKAFDRDEVPVGAVVVDSDGNIVSRAYNQTIKKCSPFAHAEVEALRKAAKKDDDWRLDGCTLYVTLEPCALCMQVIVMSRISRLVYGAPSALYGFSCDRYCTFDLSKMSLMIEHGVEEVAAQDLLKQFFKKKRRRFNDATKKSGSG